MSRDRTGPKRRPRRRSPALIALLVPVLLLVATTPAEASFGDVDVIALGPSRDHAAGLTGGPDGNVWFTAPLQSGSAPRLWSSTPAGVLSSGISLGTTGVLTEPVLGADGNLWLAQTSPRDVIRVTPAGVITRFNIPGTRLPVEMTAGPDDAVYLTTTLAFLESHIVRRSTDGVGVTTSVNSQLTELGDITTGPDGNIWYLGHAAMGRMTPAGAVTTFPVPSGTFFAGGITTGPDGNLWWTDRTNNRIGRTNPTTGEHTMFSAAGQISSPRGIVAGPDGNVWFASTGNNRIGRVTPAGVITTFTHPNLVNPTKLIVGPDQRLWITSSGFTGTPVIHRFTVIGPPTVPLDLSATPGDGQVTLSWQPPAELGGSAITAYRVFRNGFQIHQTADGSTLSHTVTGLANGQSSTYRVAAVNASGAGSVTDAISATPRTVPAAPTLTTATPGNGQVSLTWTAPASDGGAAITAYRVLRDGQQVHQTPNGATLSHTVTGLTNGESASFTVRAVNVAGQGPPSNTLDATPDASIGPSFVDVSASHPFFADIEWMAAQGISTGFQPGPTYRPADPVSRAAMSAFMYRLAGSPAFSPGAPTFGDVSGGHPFFAEIEWMASEGITTGTAASPKPLYKPAAAVSRAAMSAFMYRLAGEPSFTPPAGTTFGDVSASHPFFAEIEWMASEGITTGTAASPKPLYKPADAVSRGAMSAFMHRLADGPGVGV